MVMSDFRPEVEIRPFCACAMKNMQYNPYLWPIRQNFRVFQEIGIEEDDGDVRFKSVACAMHPTIIIGTVRFWSLWTGRWIRYHVPQNVFLV